MSAGDLGIVLFPFSHTEPQPYKKRPVLILGSTGHGADEAIFVAMVTGNAKRYANPAKSDVPIVDWRGCGLRGPSVVRATRLWTAQRRDFDRLCIGTVASSVLADVRDIIRTGLL